MTGQAGCVHPLWSWHTLVSSQSTKQDLMKPAGSCQAARQMVISMSTSWRPQHCIRLASQPTKWSEAAWSWWGWRYVHSRWGQEAGKGLYVYCRLRHLPSFPSCGCLVVVRSPTTCPSHFRCALCFSSILSPLIHWQSRSLRSEYTQKRKAARSHTQRF